ncbi:hypothetical protein CDAR_90491 [Caerostris darwini]|uniref:Uncharacterized protein n=1 Tax=Caerostris darwini TaxID=1538125 RepID=A0AAV4VD10_9ARAC|nr:hypothetical protein CDAR_90491 [Caerostris darwini]
MDSIYRELIHENNTPFFTKRHYRAGDISFKKRGVCVEEREKKNSLRSGRLAGPLSLQMAALLSVKGRSDTRQGLCMKGAPLFMKNMNPLPFQSYLERFVPGRFCSLNNSSPFSCCRGLERPAFFRKLVPDRLSSFLTRTQKNWLDVYRLPLGFIGVEW